MRRTALCGFLGWFVADSAGSIAFGNSSDAVVNIVMLLLAIGRPGDPRESEWTYRRRLLRPMEALDVRPVWRQARTVYDDRWKDVSKEVCLGRKFRVLWRDRIAFRSVDNPFKSSSTRFDPIWFAARPNHRNLCATGRIIFRRRSALRADDRLHGERSGRGTGNRSDIAPTGAEPPELRVSNR